MRFLLRFLGWVFAGGTILFFVGATGAAAVLFYFSKDLPDYSQLQDYEPTAMTILSPSYGSHLSEYTKEPRLHLPIQAFPETRINAVITADGQRFYQPN